MNKSILFRPLTPWQLWLLICLLCLNGFILPVWSQPAIKAEVDRQTLDLDEVLRLKVIVLQETTDSAQIMQPDPPQFSSLTDFDVVSRASNQSINVVQNVMRMMATYTFILKPRQSGTLKIPPLFYRYESQGQIQTLETEDFTIQVNAPPSTSPNLIRLLLLGFGILGLFIIVFLLVYFWRQRPRATSPSSPPHQPPPKEGAQPQQTPQKIISPKRETGPLDAIRNMRDQNRDQNEMIQALQYQLKDYLSQKLQIDCQSQTTAEILEHLKHQTNFPEKWQIKVSESLKKCDQYRFQPFPVSAEEFDLLLDQTEQIIKNRTSG